jgi:hypothetical protein
MGLGSELGVESKTCPVNRLNIERRAKYPALYIWQPSAIETFDCRCAASSWTWRLAAPTPPTLRPKSQL